MAHKLLLLVLLVAHSTIQDCTINVVDVIGKFKFEPLYLKRDTLEFIYPRNKNDGSKVNVPVETEIVISCGAQNLMYSELSTDGKTILAKCNSQSKFEMNGTVFKVEDLGCYNDVMEVVKNTTKTCAKGNGVILDVSYPIDALEKQVPLYEICFDSESKNVLYSKFVSPKLANEGNNFTSRGTYPSIDDDEYYNLGEPVQRIYDSSQASINQQIGLPVDSDKYFPNNFTGSEAIWIRIVKEKLSDNVFFSFYNQQRSASRYINTVPIWDVYKFEYLNNWDCIRFGLSRFTVRNSYELEIYTGTYGVTTLPHNDTKKDIELYLYEDNEAKAFPLAKLLWRLVYHRETKKAVVLVAVNNPWVFKDDDKVCNDISAQSGWDGYLTWAKDRKDLGYAYVCSYEDFKKTVDFLPDLEVEAVLNSSSRTALSLSILVASLLILLCW